jgi:hypothetical protein
MKQRLKKKLLKKAQAAGQLQPGPPVDLTDSAKLFAIECWRIKKLLPEFSDNKKYLVLTSSIEKMVEALAATGIEIEDPEKSEFRDGMTLEVALFEKTPLLAEGKRVISETLAPAVYVKNRLVQPAKVIVSVGGRSE